MFKLWCSNSWFIMTVLFIRFVTYDVDMFGEPNFIGQLTLPVKCALTGFRSVPLKNGFSEELELSGRSY